MANWKIDTLRDQKNELSIRYGYYSSSTKNPEKFIVFLNGRTEFIEKYDYLPDDLKLGTNCGFLTLDHRGQGGSGGARGHAENYENFCQDAKLVIDKVVGDKPYAIVCHSMGGLIGLYGHLTGYFSPKKLILSSPLFGIPDQPIPKKIARPLADTMTRLKIGPISAHFGQNNKPKFSKNKLTHSISRYEKIQDAPFQIPSVTFGWVDATFEAIDYIFSAEGINNLKTDVFLMGSPDDKVVDHSAWQKWIKIASAKNDINVGFELFHGAKHELYSEIPKYYDRAVSTTLRELEDFLQS